MLVGQKEDGEETREDRVRQEISVLLSSFRSVLLRNSIGRDGEWND